MPAFEAHYSKRNFWQLFAIFPIGFAIAVARHPHANLIQFAEVAAVIAVVMFLIIGFIAFGLKPFLVATSSGLAWKANVFSSKAAPWDQIKQITMETGYYGSALRIAVQGEDKSTKLNDPNVVRMDLLDKTPEEVTAGLAPFFTVVDERDVSRSKR